MNLRVKVGSCISSHLSAILHENQAVSVDVDHARLSSGGQGTIHKVTHVDGRAQKGLLVKIFAAGIPDNLREIVSLVAQNNVGGQITACRALRGLPLFLFEADRQGQQVGCYMMREIRGKPFSDILDNDINTYINSSLNERLHYCQQFVEGMKILYNLTIVHADINGQNLLIDRAGKELAIIDLDGGAVAKTGSTPIVIGKPEPGWLDPKIWEQLASITSSSTIEVDITADLWSIACGIHYLLFGLAPFFFIQKQPDIKQYLAAYLWPQLKGVHGIQIRNTHAFDYHERVYSSVPQLQRFFCQSFQRGFGVPSERIDASQWLIGIREQLRLLGARPSPPPQPWAKPAPAPPGGFNQALRPAPLPRPLPLIPGQISTAIQKTLQFINSAVPGPLPLFAKSGILLLAAVAATLLIAIAYSVGLHRAADLETETSQYRSTADLPSARAKVRPTPPLSNMDKQIEATDHLIALSGQSGVGDEGLHSESSRGVAPTFDRLPADPAHGARTTEASPTLTVFAGGKTLESRTAGAELVADDPSTRALGFSVSHTSALSADDEVRVEWYVDGDRKSFYKFVASDAEIGTPHSYDNLRPWPGAYEVRLLVNGQLTDSYHFKIVKGQ